MRSMRAAAGVVAVLLASGGCASSATTRFTHPGADLGAIRTVAVLPFTTLTTDRADAAKVEKIFLVELLATRAVEVIEPGKVAQVMRAAGTTPSDQLPPEELQRIGGELGADGLFFGTVVDFTQSRSGTVTAPEVTIQLRLVEVRSGSTAWTASETRAGASARSRLFGVSGDTLTEAARKLIREQLRALVKG